MQGPILTLVLVLLGLALGGLLGWLASGRPAADLRVRLGAAEAEARDRDAQFRAAIKDLGASAIELATLKANAASFDEQKAGLMQAQASLKSEFEAAGAKILGQAQEVLLERAQQRFSQSEE